MWYLVCEFSARWISCEGSGSRWHGGPPHGTTVHPRLGVTIDIDETRLATARKLRAHATVNAASSDAEQRIMNLPENQEFDSIIEAVGVPVPFALCQKVVGIGGLIVNVGVHGTKVDLYLETWWERNMSELQIDEVANKGDLQTSEG
jgi:threonine dehydrogenase-like Zn-dependent dehydrogenase